MPDTLLFFYVTSLMVSNVSSQITEKQLKTEYCRSWWMKCLVAEWGAFSNSFNKASLPVNFQVKRWTDVFFGKLQVKDNKANINMMADPVLTHWDINISVSTWWCHTGPFHRSNQHITSQQSNALGSSLLAAWKHVSCQHEWFSQII